MRKWSILMAVVVVLALLLACGAPAPTPEPAPTPTPEPPQTPAPAVPPEKAHLRPNPVEESMPIYGGTLLMGHNTSTSFDGHQRRGYGPMVTLPTFNQLVIYDMTYKDTVPENIIGDLAESWEWSQDKMDITFKLHQGVKWHDGTPFTADDVVYSLDKMADPTRSAIYSLFGAYESAEKVDDYTVKVHLKSPSAGFLLALAEGQSVIQPKHLAGTSDTAVEFMIGTGPWILTEYITRVSLKWKRNPDYFKKDQYGNQLPYMDALELYQLDGQASNDQFIARRVDIKSTVTCATTIDTYLALKEGAPELVWQYREATQTVSMQLNTAHKPLDDIRVRRAMGLVMSQDDLIIGYSGDTMFKGPGMGFLPVAFGLPDDEVIKLMGWDKPWSERVAEAKKLMAEAGYPNGGFKVRMISTNTGSPAAYVGLGLILAEAWRTNLGIDAEVVGLAGTGVQEALNADDYDTYSSNFVTGADPVQLQSFFRTGGDANYMKYSNSRIDEIFDNLDQELDPLKRREMVQEMERILLTDLPALPSGLFLTKFHANYPHVRNLRYNDMSYSNVCRLEDVWIDPSLIPPGFRD